MPTPNWTAYQNALLDAVYDKDLGEARRMQTANRVGGVARYAVNKLITPTPVVPAAAQTQTGLGPTIANASPAVAAPASTFTPAASMGLQTAGGFGTAAAANTSIYGSIANGSTGGATTAMTAGTTASEGTSALGSTGIGAIIAAGLMVGGSKPGDWLFPVKKSGYNALHGVYGVTGGTTGERYLTGGSTGWGPEAVVNKIWGDPNVQEQEAKARSRKLALASALGALTNISEKRELATAQQDLSQYE